MKISNLFLSAKPYDKWLYICTIIICEPLIFSLCNNNFSYFSLNAIFGLLIAGILLYDLIIKLVNRQRISITKSYSFWFLLAFVVWIFIGSFFTINKSATWAGLFEGKHVKESVWQYIFYFLFFCAARKTQKSNRYYLTSVMVWLMCFYIILGFISLSGQYVPGFLNTKNNYALMFYHQNHSGYLATITAMLALHKMASNTTAKQRFAFGFAFCLHIVFLCVNGSFGPILAVSCAIVASLVVYLTRKNWLIAKRIAIAFCVFISIFALIDFTPKLKELKSDNYPLYAKYLGVIYNAFNINPYTYNGKEVAGSNGYARIPMWKDCLKTASEKPLFGTGTSTFQNKYPKYNLANPHNEYLQYMSANGIPALIFYLAFIVSLFVNYFKRKNHSLHYNNACIGAIFAYLISAFFGCTMGCIMPQLFLIFGFSDIKEQKQNNA